METNGYLQNEVERLNRVLVKEKEKGEWCYFQAIKHAPDKDAFLKEFEEKFTRHRLRLEN